ncbi:MAG: hypothetical protein ABSA82_03230 [Thermacetogeniaceae bacterium]
MPINTEHDWLRIETPELPPGAETYAKGERKAIVSKDDQGHWHLSIFCKNRYPTIDEIRDARFTFCPKDITMAIILLPDEHPYMRKNGVHLCEIEGEQEQADSLK